MTKKVNEKQEIILNSSKLGGAAITRRNDYCSGCATMLISLGNKTKERMIMILYVSAPCRRLIRSKFSLYVFPVCCYNIRIFGRKSIQYRIECCKMRTLDC